MQLAGPDGVGWSACVRDAGSGQVLGAVDAAAVRRTASVGKLLLLLEVARGLAEGRYDPDEELPRPEAVADSGLWQHLRTDALRLHDAALLVAAVSDNLATNALLDRTGLAAVQRTAAELGLRSTALHDRVRDRRGPAHAPTLSTGSAQELTSLLVRLGQEAAGRQVLDWLSTGCDLSMVAGAWGLDPLAHAGADRGVRVVSKTGTDDGVRADVGLVAVPGRALAYAVLAEWDPTADRRDEVLDAMRAVGTGLRRELQP